MATKFQYLARHAFKQLRPLSRALYEGQPLSGTNSVPKSTSRDTSMQIEKLSSLFSSNSEHPRQFNNMANTGRPDRPYTVVVEGNIGSGKV